MLTFGDSLMQSTATTIASLLPDMTVTDRSFGGSNPIQWISPNGVGISVADYLVEQLDALHPDAVVFEYAGNCRNPCLQGYGTAAFFAAWTSAVQELDRLATSRGVKTLWVLPPPRDELDVSSYATLADIYRSLGAPTVSWIEALTAFGTGRWVERLAFAPRGQDQRVIRVSSGIHLAPEGIRRAAVWTAAALRGL